MKKRQQFVTTMATTHVDLHGERFAKELLEEFASEKQTIWLSWDHQTTLPPLGIAKATSVRLRDDGEYELVGEGEIFDDEDYEELVNSNIVLPDPQVINSAEYIPISFLEVAYDQVNFSPNEIRPLIEWLNEIILDQQKIVVRK